MDSAEAIATPQAMSPAIREIKPDADEAAARMRDWWAGKQIDRAVAAVTAPLDSEVRRERRGTCEERLTDLETVCLSIDAEIESTFYGGEAFPAFWVFPIAVPVGAYLGCDLSFRNGTVWQHPAFPRWEDPTELVFDTNNHWWQLVRNLTRATMERSAGRYMVSGCGICGLVDVMANMWGSETVLEKMAVDPELFAERLGRMVGFFRRMYDELHAIVAPHQYGYFDWHSVWAPGRVCTLQNDLSCMVSPGMFEKLCLEEIMQEAAHVDFALYHLDGPGAIRHLDALLGIDQLDGIQWVPGAGASQDPLDWLDLLKRIQNAGKKLSLGVPAGRVEPLLKAIDRHSAYLRIRCSDRHEAQDVLALLDRMG